MCRWQLQTQSPRRILGRRNAFLCASDSEGPTAQDQEERMANEKNASQLQPQPDEKLVQVFGTPQESEALVVQSLLNSAGIESVMIPTDAPQDVLAGVGGFVVRVREEQSKQA